jgi:hypothetical protein
LRHIHRRKSLAIPQALSLLQQTQLLTLLAVGHEIEYEANHVGVQGLVIVVNLTSTTEGWARIQSVEKVGHMVQAV